MTLARAAALVGVLLAGCATRSPQVPPDAGVAVPAGWTEPVPPRQGAAEGVSWWDRFGDAELSALVQQALRSNTTIATAQASLREARALRTQAAAALWPQLSVSASAARSRRTGAQASGNLFDAGFDASWEADLFGGNTHGVAAQQAATGAAAASLDAARVSIAAEVAMAYLDLRSAQARTAVARENLATQEETLQLARWRVQAGLASSVQEQEAATAVEQTRATIPSLQAAAAQSAHALAVLTGRAPGSLASRAAPVPEARGAPEVAVPAEVLRRRPDVLASELQVKAAAERVAQADAQRRPAVQLAASLAWTGTTLGSLGSIAAARSLVASAAQPLFDAGLRNAQLEQRRAQFDAALQAYRASVLAALQDVEDSLVSLSSDRERLAALQSALEAARNAALLARQRYESGLIDFLTVLDTQRTLLGVQDSVATARAGLAADHVRLYKALGGGWDASRATEEPS